MMTPQEVANCTFAKSVMGGYNMASVDDFLDKLTEDYSALFKENAALKGKLKKTVDEVNKYRESEGTICSTLLAAQKNPEEYRDLIVRVAGYSDYFRNLDKPLQDEIIERTEQDFGC